MRLARGEERPISPTFAFRVLNPNDFPGLPAWPGREPALVRLAAIVIGQNGSTGEANHEAINATDATDATDATAVTAVTASDGVFSALANRPDRSARLEGHVGATPQSLPLLAPAP